VQLVLVVTVVSVTALANAAIAAADMARAKFVLANSAQVGVPETWLPGLAFLKGAGALGLFAGLLGPTAVGIAAATGLLLFYTGAVLAHVRARVFHNIAFPGAYLVSAAASLALMLTR